MLYRFGAFELDPDRFQLRRNGGVVAIQRQVFDLLHLLIRHRHRPVTHEELLESVWEGRAVAETSVRRCVSEARKALGDLPRHQRIIKTVHGRGYWFVADVALEHDAQEQPRPVPATRWPFVGRLRELERIAPLLDGAARGGGSFLLLTGEAGIGKTRMAQEVAHRATERGFLATFGSCREVADAPPAWPWVAVLRALERRFLLRSATGELGRAFENVVASLPELEPGPPRSPRPPPEDARAARLRLFDDVSTVLRGCAAERPLLLVFDDLHRADRLSLQLLRFVARDLPQMAALAIGTRREPDPEVELVPPDLGELTREPHATVLRVPRLTRDEASELIESTGLALSGPRSRGALFERSGGNPFFLLQLLSLPDVAERLERADGDDASAWLPRTLRELILAQVEGLPGECRDLLRSASVCGRAFTTGMLASSAGTTLERVLEGVQPAIRLGVLERADAPADLCFTHVLLRDVLYRELPPAERTAHHLRIAEALQAAHGDAPGPHSAELAHHARLARPLGELDLAVEQTVAAARWAAEHLAFDEAALHCRNALDLLKGAETDSDRRAFDILLALAGAQLRAGLREEGRDTLRKVYGLADDLSARDRIADVALAIAPGFFSIETGVVDQLLITTLEEAIDAIGPDPTPVRVRLLCQLAQALYWSDPGPRRRALVEEAEANATALDDPESHAHTRLARFAALWGPDNFEERMSLADEVVRGADRMMMVDDQQPLLARVFRIANILERGDSLLTDRLVEEFEGRCRMSTSPHGRWYPPAFRSMRAIMEGRYSDATQEIADYVSLGRRLADVNVFQTFLLQLVEILWHQDRIEPWLPDVESHARRFASNPEWRCALCFLYEMSGRSVDAKEEMIRIVAHGFDQLYGRMNGEIACAALAWVCMLQDDKDVARFLLSYSSRTPLRHTIAGYGVLYWGTTELTLGLLKTTVRDFASAEEHIATSIEMTAAAGARPWNILSILAYARLLARWRSGDLREPREMAADAIDRGRSIGMTVCKRLAEGILY